MAPARDIARGRARSLRHPDRAWRTPWTTRSPIKADDIPAGAPARPYPIPLVPPCTPLPTRARAGAWGGPLGI